MVKHGQVERVKCKANETAKGQSQDLKGDGAPPMKKNAPSGPVIFDAAKHKIAPRPVTSS